LNNVTFAIRLSAINNTYCNKLIIFIRVLSMTIIWYYMILWYVTAGGSLKKKINLHRRLGNCLTFTVLKCISMHFLVVFLSNTLMPYHIIRRRSRGYRGYAYCIDTTSGNISDFRGFHLIRFRNDYVVFHRYGSILYVIVVIIKSNFVKFKTKIIPRGILGRTTYLV